MNYTLIENYEPNHFNFSIHFFTVNVMAQKKIVQTAGRDQLGEFAPKFAELNDDVLFGEVWSRTDKLGLRDRSLVTITSLISQGITDSSLTFHLQSAKRTVSPVRRLRRLSRISGFMQVGQRHGRLFVLPRMCGRKMQTERMLRQHSSVR